MNTEILNNNLMVDVTAVTEQATLDDFLRSIQKPGYRMAQLSTRNTEEALDVLQDAILKLLQNYRHKPVAELKPLFYSILTSKLTDWHRKRQFRSKFNWILNQQEDEADPIENMAAEFDMSTEQLLSTEREMVTLVSAISELSERQRQALLLRHWHGYSEQETASIMQCSTGSVKTHLHRAIHTLRECDVNLESES